MLLLATVMFLYAADTYLRFDLDAVPDIVRESFKARPWGIYSHVIGGMTAIIIGPFQFLPIIRNKYLKIHRWLGRIYLAGVLFGGLGGLYIALYAFGGFPTSLGLASLGVLWLWTGFMAYQRIRQKNVSVHKEWMIRNYALTFAAATFRLWIFLFEGILDININETYPAVAWFCWVPNLIVAEWIVNRSRGQSQRGGVRQAPGAVVRHIAFER